MGALVVDANVVIGFTRPDDAHHRAASAAIRAARLRGDVFILLATVLSEALVAAHRVSAARAAEGVADLTSFFGSPRVVDTDVADHAAALRAQRTSLRLPDALVVATGIVDDATVLTCDRRLAGVDERVQVLEP